jgi:hypothetical protein
VEKFAIAGESEPGMVASIDPAMVMRQKGSDLDGGQEVVLNGKALSPFPYPDSVMLGSR